MRERLQISEPVRHALARGAPVVALETTVLAHGLPWPRNLEVVREMGEAITAGGATPALIGLVGGRIAVGMEEEDVERFARARESGNAVEKASRRDLAPLLATGRDGATTVAGTLRCAALAGIRVFATGGIGGVHRGATETFDVSADLVELARSPVAVVCAGAKSILDLPRTLEVLETAGVPVLGLGCDELPAFHARSSGLPVGLRVEDAAQAAAISRLHLASGDGAVLITVPIPEAHAIDSRELEGWIAEALGTAARRGVNGKAVTPFLLEALALRSGGRTLAANHALLVHNAAVAANLARELARSTTEETGG